MLGTQISNCGLHLKAQCLLEVTANTTSSSKETMALPELMDVDPSTFREDQSAPASGAKALTRAHTTPELWEIMGGKMALQSKLCQRTTSFLLQSCLRVFPTLTLDTFSTLWTPTTFQFQKCLGVLPTLSPFQQPHHYHMLPPLQPLIQHPLKGLLQDLHLL